MSSSALAHEPVPVMFVAKPAKGDFDKQSPRWSTRYVTVFTVVTGVTVVTAPLVTQGSHITGAKRPMMLSSAVSTLQTHSNAVDVRIASAAS